MISKLFFVLLLLIFSSGTLAGNETVSGIGKYESNNVFAKILQGKIPAKIVFENEYVLAFEDIHPIKPVHVLIIPKGQYRSLVDFSSTASDEEIIALVKSMAKIAKVMGLTKDGFSLMTNSGHNGGQTVAHLHFHLLGGEPVNWEKALREEASDN
ncbi:MAG: histidine triad nucleotide-binding protein [Colwellia sp.]|nr:histidine triad nucleotide-binding protein [Colwellia sp.]